MELAGGNGVGGSVNAVPFCTLASFGCTDPEALNYDPEAVEDDGSCDYPTCYEEGSYCYISGLSNALVYVGNAPAGETAYLYITQGNIEDGYDQLYIYDGLSFDSNLLFSAGENFVTGYEDFSGTLITSTTGTIVMYWDTDGSVSCATSSTINSTEWIFACSSPAGCTDAMACNFDAAIYYDDGSCDYSCIGCMDTTAANFDPNATMQGEGSCVYCESGTYVVNVEMTDAGGDGWNDTNYFLTNIASGEFIEGNWDNAAYYAGDVATDFACIELGCYNFTVAGGSAIGEVGYTVSDQFGITYLTSTGAISQWDIDFGLLGTCDFAGCTDPFCFNYNPSVTFDDGSCVCPPPNNELALAEAVFCGGSFSGSLENASDPDGVIGTPVVGTAVITAGVWYEYNAPADQSVYVDLCETSFAGLASPVNNTKLHVFTLDQEGNLVFVVGNNNACGSLSGVSWVATTGTNYYIHVSRGFTDTTGVEFVMNVDCEDCEGGIPFNDFCENALPLVNGETFTGTTCCASPTLVPSFGFPFSTNYGVWFTFNSSDYDTFDYNLTNVDGGSVTLTIYLGGGDCETVATSGFIECGPVALMCYGSIEAITDLIPDTDYYFVVGTTEPENCGTFEFTTTGIYLGCTDSAADNYNANAIQDDGTCIYSTAPINDLCSDAITLPCNGGYEIYSMGGATDDDLVDCDLEDFNGCLTSTLFNPLWPSATQVPSCDDGSLLTISTIAWAGEYSNVQVTEGNTYTFNSSNNNDYLTISSADGTIYAASAGGEVEYTATADEIVRFWRHTENCGTQVLSRTVTVICGAVDEPGVWFTFEGTGELYNINTCGSNLGTRMRLYTAPSGACDTLACVNQLDDGSEAASFAECGSFDQDDASLNLISEVGVTYYLWVGSDGVTNGSFQIEMTCEEVIYGCQISAACNYNPEANIDSDDCDYTSCACDGNPGGVAFVIEMFDALGNGWSGNNAGSMGGYEVTTVDGTVLLSGTLEEAVYQIDEDNISGPEFGFDVACLDPGCYNFVFTGADTWASQQSWAVTNGADVIFSGAPSGNGAVESTPFGLGDAVCGCTDDFACNYDPAADSDNGTCEYATCAGCTDATACNYDPDATIEDGTCNYAVPVTIDMQDSDGDGWNGNQLVISDLNGEVVIQTTIPFGNSLVETYCVEPGCYVVSVIEGSFTGEVSWTITGIFGGVLSGGSPFEPTYISVGGNNCIVGCTVDCACNYNPDASIADFDSCVFDDCSGCTYMDATNYNETAIVDDGSCEFDTANPCPADLNEDGSVTTTDLLQFLGAFGSICPN